MSRDIWAVVPIKETAQAKQRLAGLLPPQARRALSLAMAEDVLCALAQVRELAGILAVTADPDAAALARRYGAEVAAEGARGGHTAAVAAAQHQLAARHLGMLALPADVPLVEPADLQHLLAAHRPAPAFTIAPAHDRKGSNAVLCTPADAVPLRFGDDSFLPHLAASRGCGIEPTVLALPNLALDIDTPDDLARLLAVLKRTATRALLDRWQIGAERLSAGGAEPRP